MAGTERGGRGAQWTKGSSRRHAGRRYLFEWFGPELADAVDAELADLLTRRGPGGTARPGFGPSREAHEATSVSSGVSALRGRPCSSVLLNIVADSQENYHASPGDESPVPAEYFCGPQATMCCTA